MKKLLLSFSLMGFMFSAGGQTSVYHPFPDSNAVWNITFGGYQSPECSKYSYTMSGDTVVSSLTYHKLIKNRIIYASYATGFCNWGSVLAIPAPSYAGAIRQDSALRKVYYLPPSASADTLLYDYNLVIGDTVKTYVSMYTPFPVVTATDSVLVGTVYHKRWAVNSGACIDGKLIEGVGSGFGLL